MRRGLSKYIFLGIVLFIVICILASPMPMGKMEQSFVTQDYDEDMPDMIRQFATSAVQASEVVHILAHVEVTGASTGDINMGYTFDRTKTFFMWSMRPDTNIDDDNSYALSLHWKDNDEITWMRAGAVDHDFWLSIWAVEFTSGIEVWELGPFSTTGAQNIGDTVVMADTFVINSGYTNPSVAHDDDWPVVYLSSTTQVTVVSHNAPEAWSNFYCQVIEGVDLTVQRGIEVDPNTDPIDITVSAVTIARTQILLQETDEYNGWRDCSSEAYFSDTTSLIIDRYGTWTDRNYYWEIVEWPVGTTIQHVGDTLGTADTSGSTTIDSVDTTVSVALLEGTWGASQMGALCIATADEYGENWMTTEFASSTSVTATRLDSGYATEYRVCVITFPSNTAPVNDQTPICTNLDDGDNLYARYRIYNFSTSVTDADGATDINYVELSSMNGATPVWTVKYLESDNSFSETLGTTLIELTGSVYTKSGVNLDIWFGIRIEWAHPDANDYDLKQYVVDDAAESDTNTYSAIDYDYDTDLTTTFTLNDGSGIADHGNYNSIDSITASGRVSYEDSGGNNYPPDASVDMYIRCSDVAGSDWSDVTPVSGEWSVTVDSDDVIGLDTYYVKAVLAGGNYDSASLLGSTISDTYIADRVRVVSYTIVSPSGDNRNNVGTTYTIDIELHYDLYETDVVDGTVTVNGESMDSYQGSGKFRWTPTQAGVIGITYNNMQITGNAKGITVEDNTVTQLIIWDRIKVMSYTIVSPVGDNRNNIGTTYTIDIELHYDYDETDVADGTITVNGESMDSYQGSGKWRWTPTQAGVTGITYNNMAATGNTHGITVEDNTVTQLIIWDRVKVVSYTIVNPSGDNRNNIGTTYTIDIELHYDYDETDVADGTITVNGESMDSYQGSGKWRWTPYQAGMIGITYNNMQATGNTHGITAELNTVTQLIIWDQIYVVSLSYTGSPDTRINVGTSINFDWELHYDYDEADVTDGTVTINGYACAHQGSGIWRYTNSSGLVGDLTLDNIAVTGNTHGITSDNQNGKTVTMIWDRIIILTTTTDDGRIDISTAATIAVTAQLEYDSHALGTGDALYMNNTAMSWNGTHFTLTPNFAVVDLWSFFVNSSSANEATHGITVINLDGNSVNQIWDSLTVTITNPTDQRININANASGMHLSAIWDYDSQTYDGTLTLNDTTYDHGTVGIYYYTVTAGDGDDTYGITAVSSSDSVYCIFDRIKILTTAATDNYIEYGTESTAVNVTAELQYDSHALGSGDTLYMNNTEMTWDTDHFYIVFGPYSVVGSWDLFVNSSSANEVTYSITTVWLNGQSDTVATDRVKVISYAISDARDNVDDYIWLNVTVQYESDSAAVTDGTIVINSYSFTHLGSGIWRHNRTQASATGITFDTAVASGNTRGITVVNQNGQSQVAVWDSYTISFTVGDNRININVNATVGYTVISDHDAIAYDGTVNLNYTTWEQATVQRQGFTVSSLSGDDTYGITAISTNDADYVIWDSYTIAFTVGDNRININDNATVGYTAISDYDSISYDGTVNLNYTTWEQANVQRQGFTVSSLSGDDTYGITAIKTNDADYLIWDAIGVNMWIDDGRDNIDDTITVYAWLTYMYDMTNVTDGTVLLNGTGMSYGSSIWSLGRIQSTAGLWSYNITSISGNTHGITIIGETNFDGDGDYVTSICELPLNNFTISFWFKTSDISIGTQRLIHSQYSRFSIHLAGDDLYAQFYNGTSSYYSYQANVITNNVWYHVLLVKSSTTGFKCYLNGVVLSNTNAETSDVLYVTDDISIGAGEGAADSFSNYLNGSIDEVRVYNRTLGAVEIFELYQQRYGNDTGLILELSLSGWDEVDVIWYDSSGEGNDGTIVGATVIEYNNSNYVRLIWDQIKILGYNTNSTDNRDNIGTYVNISVWIQYDYDDTNVTDGTIVINSDSYAYNAGSGNWTALFSNATASDATWDTVVASGNTYGITSVNQNSKSQAYIWDEIEVYWNSESDARTNVDEQEWPLFKLRSKYDNHEVNISGSDTVYINSSLATWSGGSLAWYKFYTQSSVGIWNFLVTSVSEDTYGITALDTASAVTWDKDIIWDKVIVMGYNTNSTDNRDNINDCFNVSVWIQYEYDSTNVTDGTISINGDSFAYNAGSGNWTALFSNATASDATWDTIVASGNTHGITYENQNGKSQKVIWDSLTITMTGPSDNRIDINANASGIGMSAIRDYDSSGFDGTLTLNDTTYDHGSVGIYYYTIQSASGGTYDITVISTNDDTYCIFDRILILTTTVTDGRINYGLDNTTLNVTARLEYEGGGTHNLGSGDTLYMNDTSMTWDTDHFYLVTGIYSIVDIINYFVNSSSANEATYGITVVNLDSNNADVIWDRIKILTTTVTDGRIDYGTNTMINVTAELEYDSHGLGSGDTLYMNGTSMTWDTDHFYLTTGSYSIVDLINYFVNSSNANEVTHGITVINLDGNNADVIWDRIKILTTTVTDGRIDYGTTTILNVTATLEYAAHSLGSGDTLYMNGTSMTWDTDHFYLVTGSYNIVDIIGYYVNSTSANEATHGITVINLDGNDASVIWDRIKILTTTVTDGRIDYGTSTTVNVTAELEYDSHELISGDTLYMNDTSMTWDTDHWYITTGSYNIVDIINYFVNSSSANEVTYGITVINLDSNNDDVIWDRILILITVVTDGRINYGIDTTTINVTARLEYNTGGDHNLGSGDTLYMNDTGMTWDTDHFYLVTGSYSIVDIINYFVNSSSANEATYGITVINLDGNSANVIWDRVQVQSYTVTDSWVDVNVNVNIDVLLYYDYDNSDVTDGAVTLNGNAMAHQGSGTWRYTTNEASPAANTYDTIAVSGNTHGITVEDQQGLSHEVLWDRIIWQSVAHVNTTQDYGSDGYRVNEGVYVRITLQLQYEYNSTNLVDGTVTLNGESMTYNTTPGYWYLDVMNSTSAYGQHYNFTSIAVSGNVQGITIENQNSQSLSVIWDEIVVLTTVATDSYIDPAESTTINVTAQLRYDNHTVGSGDTLRMNDTGMTWDTDHWYLTVGSYGGVYVLEFFVNSTNNNEATYTITVIDVDGNSAIIGSEQVKVISYVISDARDNVDDYVWVNVTVQYESDSADVVDGTIVINGYSFTYLDSGIWRHNRTESSVGDITFDTVVASGNARSITTVNQNGQSQLAIWDRIIISTTVATDGRIDYGTTTTINVTATLEYAAHTLGSGDTLYMNGTSMTWDTDHFYLITDAYNIVDLINYFVNSSNANEATYGITVINLDGNNADVIWDRILILTTVATDGRIDYGTTTMVNVTAELEYDHHTLGTADTLYMNDTLMTWDTDHYYITTGSYNIVDIINYFVNSSSANEVTYSITVINLDGNNVDIIWDRIKILTTVTDDSRVGYDTQAIIAVTAQLEYDYHVLGTGDTLYMNGTQMTWNDTHFILNPQFTDVDIWNFYVNSTSANEATYGITVISLDGNSVNQIWDRVVFTWNANMTWTIVTYYINVSFTAIHEYDSATFVGNLTAGNCTITNSTTAYEILTESPYENYTYYTTSVIDDVYEITSYINTVTAWCVFDNITATESHGVTVTDYSKTFFIFFGELQWQYNGSNIGIDWICLNMRNGTQTTIATTLADSVLSPIKQEIYVPINWDGVLYSNNATKTVGGRSYNFQWFTIEHSVMPAQTIVVENVEVLDVTLTVTGTTNVDFTWSIYDDGSPTGETDGVSDANDFKIEFDKSIIYGWRNYSIYFDAGAGGNRWYNSSYFNYFDLRIEIPEKVGDSMEIKGTSNVNCVWYIYNRDTADWTGETDSIAGGSNYFQFLFTLQTASGKHNYSLYFNISASVYIWKNGSYYITPTIFDVDVEGLVFHDSYVQIIGTSNMDMAWYVYNEGVYSIGETGSELANIGFTFSFVKNTSVGKHNFSIYFNDTVDGSQYRWFNRSYTVSTLYSYCSVVLYGPEGTGLNPLLFKVLINGTEHTSSTVTFYGGINLVHNVTVLNYFDEVVGSGINQMPDDKIIRVLINVYTFKIYNQMDDEFIYFNMTSSGGAEWSEHIGPREMVKFILYSGNTYTYTFAAISGPSGGTHTGSVTVSHDTGMIIDGYDLVEIYEGISRAGGGGKVSVEDLYVALSAVQGGMLTQVQFFSWLSVILLFVGLYVIPFVKSKGKIRGPKDVPEFSETYGGEPGESGAPARRERKKPVPKQLKDHTYKEGLLNPKFHGGPSMQEMSDKVWGALRREKPKKKKRRR